MDLSGTLLSLVIKKQQVNKPLADVSRWRRQWQAFIFSYTITLLWTCVITRGLLVAVGSTSAHLGKQDDLYKIRLFLINNIHVTIQRLPNLIFWRGLYSSESLVAIPHDLEAPE